MGYLEDRTNYVGCSALEDCDLLPDLGDAIVQKCASTQPSGRAAGNVEGGGFVDGRIPREDARCAWIESRVSSNVDGTLYIVTAYVVMA